ncbi:hypothetical protein L1987_72388 [Smallanthus sonchifolius]|uniref:Uncharacterized protein n=1 Tax=Smallanthus sonchifolius TaxID=185202 RepID=A0ACB9AVC8_9ASTR|nr:hypothetical protein L1987_72388 [Smallanthus sonchifolius]
MAMKVLDTAMQVHLYGLPVDVLISGFYNQNRAVNFQSSFNFVLATILIYDDKSNKDNVDLSATFSAYELDDYLHQKRNNPQSDFEFMLDPVLSMLRLRVLLAPEKSYATYQDANDKDEFEERSQKRLKVTDPLNVSSASYDLTEE